MFKKTYMLLLPLIMVLFTGCGIDDYLVKKGQSAVNTVKSMETETTKAKSAFNASNNAKEMAFYVEKEKLNNSFKKSEALIKQAKAKSATISTILKNDDDRDEARLKMLINQVNSFYTKVKEYNNFPSQRLERLIEVKKEAPVLYKNILNIEKNMKSVIARTLTLLENNQKDFPQKKVDIDSKIKTLKGLEKTVIDSVVVAKTELDKDNKMDISNFVNAVDLVKTTEKKINMKRIEFEAKMKELSTSYTKILADMKSKHYVIVGRASWDNYYDYPTEHTYIYKPALIPDNMLQTYSLISGTIASYNKGFLGSFKLRINKSEWDKLRLNKDEMWSSGDDEAEYWIEDIRSVYYHKYIIVKNDKKTETNWVKVDEDTFYNNVDNLGMSLVSKAYGDYESESVVTATPPGLAFVNNPRYGEWKQDSQGNSFFYYYGMYSMFNDLSGNNRYSRDYYNTYHKDYRNDRPYYAGGYGTYGKRTYSTGSKYSRSSYASRNKTAIRNGSLFKRKPTSISRSVRKAGSSSRGRGAGGGGK